MNKEFRPHLDKNICLITELNIDTIKRKFDLLNTRLDGRVSINLLLDSIESDGYFKEVLLSQAVHLLRE